MTNAPRQTKSQRQSAAREKARAMREAEAKKARNRKWIIQGSVAVGVLAVVVIIALVIINVAKPAPPATTAGPKNMASDGIILTGTTKYVSTAAIPDGGSNTPTTPAPDGKAHIVIYEDLQCPVCRLFEVGSPENGVPGNNDQIGTWLDAGIATIEIHPISFLDSSSGTNHYSSRAANAVACVANDEPDKFWAVNEALYEQQPTEGTGGMSDDDLIGIVADAGAKSDAVATCIRDQTFKGWVKAATQRVMGVNTKTPPPTPVPNTTPALARVTGTPTIYVNGKLFNRPSTQLSWADTDAFKTFVAGVVGGDWASKAG